MIPGDRTWNVEHREICRVVDVQTLWGAISCRVWLPESGTVVRVPASRLKFLAEARSRNAENVAHLAATARVADALTQNVLLAPIESSVILLPHQIHALSHAIASDQVRYLLADEVGLCKTDLVPLALIRIDGKRTHAQLA